MYTYTHNNPIVLVDPDGNAVDVIVDIGFIVYDIIELATPGDEGEWGFKDSANWAALGGDIVGAMVPFATGVGAGIKAGIKAGKAADAGKTGKIVIGENMERVKEVADKTGAKVFKGKTMAENKKWIIDAKKRGDKIIDIGPDFARRKNLLKKGKKPSSDFYDMERKTSKDYEGYEKLFNRKGKYEGGTPLLEE